MIFPLKFTQIHILHTGITQNSLSKMQQRKSSSLTDVELIASVSHQLTFMLCVVHWRPLNRFFDT